MRYVTFETEFGFFGILGNEAGILRTCLPVRERLFAENELLWGTIEAVFDAGLLPDVQKQIKSYFAGGYVEFAQNTTLDLDGLSQFSQDILTACRKIPYGQRVSYREIAEIANHPKAARAVGNALGNNPIPLIIPCHRVVKSDGTIGGFQRNRPGGTDLKKRMLDLER